MRCILEGDKMLAAMSLDKPLTNTQVELLKAFSHDLSEEELVLFRRTIARFFADRASDEVDKLWNERGWDNSTMDEWLRARPH